MYFIRIIKWIFVYFDIFRQNHLEKSQMKGGYDKIL